MYSVIEDVKLESYGLEPKEIDEFNIVVGDVLKNIGVDNLDEYMATKRNIKENDENLYKNILKNIYRDSNIEDIKRSRNSVVTNKEYVNFKSNTVSVGLPISNKLNISTYIDSKIMNSPHLNVYKYKENILMLDVLNLEIKVYSISDTEKIRNEICSGINSIMSFYGGGLIRKDMNCKLIYIISDEPTNEFIFNKLRNDKIFDVDLRLNRAVKFLSIVYDILT